MALFGLKLGPAPFNVSFIIALVMCFLVWVLIWRTKLGYEMRTLGVSPRPPSMPAFPMRAPSSSPCSFPAVWQV